MYTFRPFEAQIEDTKLLFKLLYIGAVNGSRMYSIVTSSYFLCFTLNIITMYDN